MQRSLVCSCNTISVSVKSAEARIQGLGFEFSGSERPYPEIDNVIHSPPELPVLLLGQTQEHPAPALGDPLAGPP